jgi:DNA ligase (NAD+)
VENTLNVSHEYKNLAGTLTKVNTLDEFSEWLNKSKLNKSSMIASWKLDGHSIIFEFKNNRLHKALTRGANGLGKDLTSYFKKIRNGFLNKTDILLNFQLDDGVVLSDFAIAFEAVIGWENLSKLNEKFGLEFKNPRSAINGILTTDGINYAEYLTLVPLKLRLGKAHSNVVLERSDEFIMLDLLCDTYTSINLFDKLEIVYEGTNISKEISDIYASLSDSRSDYRYMVDGIVIESINNVDIQRLGYASTHPNFAIAFKFPYIEKTTKLKNIVWSTDGNSAIYTPMAILKDVIINGNTYNTVSLANYSRFMKLALRKNDTMLFQLRNDVLGWVDKIYDESTLANKNPLFEAPTECEYCGHELHNDGTFIRCINEECDLVKIGNIQNFIEKMNIKNIKRNTIEALYSSGIIDTIPDLFNIDYEAVAELEGFGESSAALIHDSISERFINSPYYDYELLGSMNIDNVSRDRSRLILRVYYLAELIKFAIESTLDEFTNKLITINGIGKEISSSLYEYLSKHSDELNNIISTINTCYNTSLFNIKSSTLGVTETQYTFVVTGDLNYSSRDELKDMLLLNGHKLTSSVTKKTSYLVTNDTSSGTVKNKKAIELNIPIINEDELYDLLKFKKPNKGSSHNNVELEDMFNV